MLLNGVDGVLYLGNIVYIVEDDAVGFDYVVNSPLATNRDGCDAVPK